MVKSIRKHLTKVYVLIFSMLFFLIGMRVNQNISGKTTSSQELVNPFPLNDYSLNNDLSKFIKTFSLHDNGNFLAVNKSEKKLYVYVDFIKIRSYWVTIGEEPGNKKKPGDNRTPEGVFLVKSIDNSSNWVYYFPNDSIAPVEGAYGPWFIRMEVPGFSGIGIHGFYHDDDLGKRASRGCIRLDNEDLVDMVNFVKPGMPVIILPGENDLLSNEINLKMPAYQ